MKSRQYYHFLFPERTVPLHCLPVNCGCEDHSASEIYEWNGQRRGDRPFAIWQYTLDGAGELEFEGRKFRLEPGLAFLVTVPGDHCYRIAPGAAHWEVLYVSLCGAETMRIFENAAARFGPVAAFSPVGGAVEAAREMVRACRERRIGNRFDASAAGYAFLMKMTAGLERGPESEDWMENLRRFCLAGIDRPLSVAELAKNMGMSYFHFCRRVRQRTGISPLEYIRALKLELASRLLQNQTASVKEVAAACGFTDPGYFIKVFRKRYGVTPGGLLRAPETRRDK